MLMRDATKAADRSRSPRPRTVPRYPITPLDRGRNWAHEEEINEINGLGWQTYVREGYDIQRLFGAVANSLARTGLSNIATRTRLERP